MTKFLSETKCFFLFLTNYTDTITQFSPFGEKNEYAHNNAVPTSFWHDASLRF